MCLLLCTTSVHNTAQNSSDNLPSPDNHHSSDVVSWRVEGVNGDGYGNVSTGYNKPETIEEIWIDSIKEDLHQRGSDIQQVAECVKDRKSCKKFVHAAPWSAAHR